MIGKRIQKLNWSTEKINQTFPLWILFIIIKKVIYLVYRKIANRIHKHNTNINGGSYRLNLELLRS